MCFPIRNSTLIFYQNMALVYISCCSGHRKLRNCSRMMKLLGGEIFPHRALLPMTTAQRQSSGAPFSQRWEESIHSTRQLWSFFRAHIQASRNVPVLSNPAPLGFSRQLMTLALTSLFPVTWDSAITWAMFSHQNQRQHMFSFFFFI